MHLDDERPCSRPKNGLFLRFFGIFRIFMISCGGMIISLNDNKKDAIEDYYVLMHSERANYKIKKNE